MLRILRPLTELTSTSTVAMTLQVRGHPLWNILLASVLYSRLTATSSTFASWLGPRAALIQSRIFIEGGIITRGNYVGTPAITSWSDLNSEKSNSGRLFNISICDSFDIQSINTDNILNPMTEILDSTAPVWVGGSLFTNNYEFYTFGGLPSPSRGNPEYPSLMDGLVYQPNSAAVAWSSGVKSQFALPPGISDYITNGAYVSVPNDKVAFMFSGMVSANDSVINYSSLDTSPDHVNKSAPIFLKADLSTLANITFEKLDWPSWIVPRSEAGMLWLPYGSKGVLLVIGGVESPQDLFTLPGKGTKGGPFMTQILVYDIANDAWHMQQTLEANSSPSQLAAFCTVITSSQDASQHFIYAYGGYDGAYSPSGFSSDAVWVLSVPSFQWILVSNGTEDHRRQSHVCIAPNPTTMISIGGVTEFGNYLPGETNIDVFDLNALAWTGRYESNSTAAYQVPDLIIKQIGGNQTGGFTVPFGLNDSLHSLFTQKYLGTTNTPFACPVVNSTSPPPPAPPPAWRTPTIASVSTFVGVALLSALVFVFYRRHRHSKEGLERTTKTRRHVLLWLRKSQAASAPAEKSQSSDKTAVEDQDSYFSITKNPEFRVFEAPSSTLTTPGLFGYSSPPFGVYSPPRAGSVEVDTESRHEIMDNPRMSISQHPLYPRSLQGDFVRSIRSNSESTWHFPESLVPNKLDSHMRARSGSISPFELPHDNGVEFLSLPPAEESTNATSEVSERQAEPAELGEGDAALNASATREAPRKKSEYATPSQSPVRDKRFSLTLPSERRSSVSSMVSNLPSPGHDEDVRRSRALDELPDRRESLIPTHPLKEKWSGPVKSVYREEFDD